MSDSIVFRERPETEEAPKRFRALKPLFIMALILYFIGLVVARIPATVGAWALHNAVPTLWLTSVEGTIWNGRAGGAQVDMGRRTVPLGKITWSLSPLSLLLFQPCVDFSSQGTGIVLSGHVCGSASGDVVAENLDIAAPVSVIQDQIDTEATGQLSIQVIRLVKVGNAIPELDARFSWQGAAVKYEGNWYSLGDLGGQAQHNESGGLDGKLFDITGPYGINLDGSWVIGSENWNVKGTVEPRGNANQDVVTALSALAEEKDGVYQIVWP